ncbi:MAG: hypothetical protein NTX16_02890 [Actinobacteria bacterium]|nr:hypothetical protein [Actinomycetota bacterium]
MSRRLRAARVSSQPPRLRATLLALGIIFALAYVFVLRTPPPVPAPKVQSIQGTYVLVRNRATPTPGATPRPASTLSGSFAARASGDAGGTMRQGLSTQADEPPTLRSSYDASQRAEQTTRTLAVGTRTRRTFDAWPPVWRVGTLSPLDYQGLAAIVRSAVEDKDRNVGIKPLEDGGRTVWRAAMTFADDDLVEVVVDQAAGLVVWHSETRRGSTETFVASPAWDAGASASPAADLGEAPAAGDSGLASQARHDRTFTYVSSLVAAGRRAGYTPLTPTLVPDGFAVKAVATADATGAPREWLFRGPAPPARELSDGERQVGLLYTRGLTWFTVQQLGPRTAGISTGLIRDALASGRTAKLSFQTAPLQYGAFAGGTAYTWFERSGPTLLVSDRDAVVYVTGALTRQELITLAEGLEPVGGAGSASPSPAP